MSHPHVRLTDTPGRCRCGAYGPRHLPEWGDDCSAAMREEIARLAAEAEGCAKETGDLRQAITEAAGIPWRPVPQPLGGTAYVCPDDKDIVEVIRKMREALVDAASTPKPAETGDCRTCAHDTFGKCGRPVDEIDKEVTRWTNYQLDDDGMTRKPDSPDCPGYRAKDPA